MADGRAITNGETAMLRAVYGSRLPYSKVTVYPHRWSWPFPTDRAMAPNGNIYMPGNEYAADFSNPKVDLLLRSTFVHESAHLYQWYVLGRTVWLRGMFDREYEYTLVAGKKWEDYGVEQSAMIAQDWWRLMQGALPLNKNVKYPLAAFAKLMPLR